MAGKRKKASGRQSARKAARRSQRGKPARRKPRTMLGWWFANNRGVLPHGDGRTVVVGATLTVRGVIVPCANGLHAAAHVFDALSYAPGSTLYRVRLGGVIRAHGQPVDKYAASKRTYLGRINAEVLLRQFARACALRAVERHWPGVPQVVVDYLRTGDESKRAAAKDAARDAAWAAAWAAARDAAWAAASAAASAAARDAASAAARDAARDAAWAAAWDAASAAARDAARAAAWDAARDAEVQWQRVLLAKLVREAFAKARKNKKKGAK